MLKPKTKFSRKFSGGLLVPSIRKENNHISKASGKRWVKPKPGVLPAIMNAKIVVRKWCKSMVTPVEGPLFNLFFQYIDFKYIYIITHFEVIFFDNEQLK